MEGQERRIPLGFTAAMAPSGLHACYVFDSMHEQLAFIAPFLAAGLRNHEQVTLGTDNLRRSTVARALLALGVDPVDAMAAGDLVVVGTPEVICPEGLFDPDTALQRLAQSSRYDATRYCGTRITGEMTWALSGVPGSERLLEYEHRLNDVLREEPTLNAVCQYDAERFDARTLKHIIQAHPLLIVGNQLIHNPRYQPTTRH